MKIVLRGGGKKIVLRQTGRRGPAGAGLPTGGTTGQVPVKQSAADYDIAWEIPPTAPVTSVNGKTGEVVLDATDVGADASGSAAQALSDANDYTNSAIGDIPLGDYVPLSGNVMMTGPLTIPSGIMRGETTFTGAGGSGDGRIINTQSSGLRIYNENSASAFRLLTASNNIYFQNTINSGNIYFSGLNNTQLTGTAIFNTDAMRINSQPSAASGTLDIHYINPTTSQTGTAGYNALRINVIQTSVGSGAKRLIHAQVDNSNVFSVMSDGLVNVTSRITGLVNGLNPSDAVNLGQLNSRLSQAQRNAIDALTSSSTTNEIIAALQAA
jgi:hypothetical protein